MSNNCQAYINGYCILREVDCDHSGKHYYNCRTYKHRIEPFLSRQNAPTVVAQGELETIATTAMQELNSGKRGG